MKLLQSSQFDTPLGSMVAIGDEERLFLLEFTERKNLKKEIEELLTNTQATLISGRPQSILSIEKELTLYFEGKLQYFTTPLQFFGTPFQKRVWAELQKIPFGETRSYSALATSVGNPLAYRAVARANGSNNLAIIVPCHRVINAGGALGGYAGGLMRKEWLLNHEK